MKRPSLLDRLTGNFPEEEFDDFFEEETSYETPEPAQRPQATTNTRHPLEWPEPSGPSEDLAVDVYQTNDAVVIKTLVAGVQPSNIDITITRDMVTISGSREDEREVNEEGYFQRELTWGSFSRTILLPEEVDVDAAEAQEKHGVLMVRLPKVNKAKQAKLKVKSR